MKPAVVLNQKDVKRLQRLVTALRQLADEIAGEAPPKVRKPRVLRAEGSSPEAS